MFARILVTIFADHRSRCARSEMTQQLKNKQIITNTCNKNNANNNADIETSINDLQFVERNQLQQTPSYKIGAAVLAPLGAFRSLNSLAQRPTAC